MAGKEQYTAQQMIDALIRAKGKPTVAARILGCDYKTVKRYIDNYPTVADARREQHEALGDEMELTLAELALGRFEIDPKTGKRRRVTDPHPASLIFALKTQYKDRGYFEKIQIEGGLDLNLINETARALADAGIDATEFFQRAMLGAKQKANESTG